MDDAIKIPKHSNHSRYCSDIAEISFSFMGDTPYPGGPHHALVQHSNPTPELSDHSGLQTGLDHCWPHAGWENVSSSTESSENNDVGHTNGSLCRPWDWWANSALLHGRSNNANRQLLVNEWGIEDDGMIVGDNQAASKDNISASSCSEAGSISLASSISDVVGATQVQDFGLGMLSDQKTFCVEENVKTTSECFPAEVLSAKIQMNEVKQAATMQRAREMETRAGQGNGNHSKEVRHSHNSLEMQGPRVRIRAGSEAEKQIPRDGGVAVTSAGGDSAMGLKLGKRTYFEDAAAGAGSSKGGKKVKPGVQTPRCQAEGCKEDLSIARDYHRRHKVCAWHSKASKVKVGDSQQRFCQQCSRFHVLAEFDEDKRSCRRRLAGHNERRRKPQPEIVPFFNGGSCSFLRDDRCSISSFMEHPFFMHHDQGAFPSASSSLDQAALAACRLHAPLTDTPSFVSTLYQPTTAEQALMLVRGASGGVGNLASHEPHWLRQESVSFLGHSLALKPPPTVQPSLEVVPASQSLSEISDSRRALSLLSSSWGSPNCPCSTTLGLCSHSSSSLEQFLCDNPITSSEQIMSSTTLEGRSGLSQDQGNFVTSGSQGLVGFLNILDRQEQRLSAGSDHGRTTREMMPLRSLQSHGSNQRQFTQRHHSDLGSHHTN